MKKIDINCLATLTFEVKWQSNEAFHVERYLGRKVNLWRDIFPPEMKDKLLGETKNARIELYYEPGQAVPPRLKSQSLNTRTEDFIRRKFLNEPVTPKQGRFYPRGLLGGHYFFPQDMRPCRVITADRHSLSVDCAHPLSDKTIQFSVSVDNFAANNCETGGRLTHWPEEILDSGPGMQAMCSAGHTDFASSGFARADESADTLFYEKPRVINHVDAQASEFIRSYYSDIIVPGMRVLDLMSSSHSHLPQGLDIELCGLGLNKDEMQSNQALNTHLVHDLNQNPEVPFADGSFDAVICSLSVEYLTDPYRIIKDAARVIKSGGVLAVSFSNRWFPPKVTRLWQELHEFERSGFVVDLLLKSGGFKDVQTISIRNWWRPEHDPHISQTWVSDPVYAVKGVKI